MLKAATSTVSMLPITNMSTSTGNMTTGGMRMVVVSSPNTTNSIGKPITITMPGVGQGGFPKTVTIKGKTSGSQLLTHGTSTQVINNFFILKEYCTLLLTLKRHVIVFNIHTNDVARFVGLLLNR